MELQVLKELGHDGTTTNDARINDSYAERNLSHSIDNDANSVPLDDDCGEYINEEIFQDDEEVDQISTYLDQEIDRYFQQAIDDDLQQQLDEQIDAELQKQLDEQYEKEMEKYYRHQALLDEQQGYDYSNNDDDENDDDLARDFREDLHVEGFTDTTPRKVIMEGSSNTTKTTTAADVNATISRIVKAYATISTNNQE